MSYAARYIEAKEGLILASSADLFLGDLDAISPEDSHAVFPLFEQSMATCITNEQDWLLEALFKVYRNLDQREQEVVLTFADRWQDSSRKSTLQRAKKILKLR